MKSICTSRPRLVISLRRMAKVRDINSLTSCILGLDFLLSVCSIFLWRAKDTSSSPNQLHVNVDHSSNLVKWASTVQNNVCVPKGISTDERDTARPGRRGFSWRRCGAVEVLLFLVLSRRNSLKAFFKLVMMAPYMLRGTSVHRAINISRLWIVAWTYF